MVGRTDAVFAVDQLAADIVKRREGQRVEIEQDDVSRMAFGDPAGSIGEPHRSRAAEVSGVENLRG